jgi:hypothetical protein
MYFMGGSHEESPVSNYLDGVESDDKQLVRGMRMKIGVALSQDGKSWGRVEGDDHTGACLGPYDLEDENNEDGMITDDRGVKIDMDEELYVAWPDVMLNTYENKNEKNEDGEYVVNEFLMFYTTCLKASKQQAIGLAVSEDGFRWSKRGIVMKPGTPGAMDAQGVARGTVSKTATFSTTTNTWVEDNDNALRMWYEGTDKDGKHRIMSAASMDGGRTWTKNEGVALDLPSEGSWDEKSLSAPHILKMDDGTLRMYYVGRDNEGNTAVGVAKSLTEDGALFEREQAQVLFGV